MVAPAVVISHHGTGKENVRHDEDESPRRSRPTPRLDKAGLALPRIEAVGVAAEEVRQESVPSTAEEARQKSAPSTVQVFLISRSCPGVEDRSSPDNSFDLPAADG